MSSDVLRFEIGTVTEVTASNGRRYFRGDIGGLRVTFVDEPERDPADGGRMRLSVWASPAPGKARHVRAPAVLPPPIVETVARPSAAQRLRDAADDAITRNGAIPPGGDQLHDIFPATDLEEAMRLFETPLV